MGVKLCSCFRGELVMYREGFVNLLAFLLVETHLSSRKKIKKQLNMQTTCA